MRRWSRMDVSVWGSYRFWSLPFLSWWLGSFAHSCLMVSITDANWGFLEMRWRMKRRLVWKKYDFKVLTYLWRPYVRAVCGSPQATAGIRLDIWWRKTWLLGKVGRDNPIWNPALCTYWPISGQKHRHQSWDALRRWKRRIMLGSGWRLTFAVSFPSKGSVLRTWRMAYSLARNLLLALTITQGE